LSLNPSETLSNSPTVTVLTLGCKVNQFESAGLSAQLESAGYTIVPVNRSPDLTVINTCTVTHKADFEARSLVRRAHRRNPLGRTVVTGCLAQTRPEEVASLPGVVLVLGQEQKQGFLEYLTDLPADGKSRVISTAYRQLSRIYSFGYPEFDRTRAFFRIQDGCSAFCSYCIVPKARGPSRSLAVDIIDRGVLHYQRAGYQEIVLTGIHLGAWGVDLQPCTDLSGLVKLLAASKGPRLRLTSIEPHEVTPEIVGLFREGGRICPHVHLPLQSGSDKILAAMKRPYRRELFRELVVNLTAEKKDLCLGVDVLVGFPGETDQDFEQTVELLSDLPISYLHVFPYSKRPGTVAAGFTDQVSPRDKKKRVAYLRHASFIKRDRFLNSCLGQIRPTLIENTRDKSTGMFRGITDNYITVVLDDPTLSGNEIVAVKITEVLADGRVLGKMVGR
jgi:threonylcarbamoyladenosine tRNA methylthiotransferase MtaB